MSADPVTGTGTVAAALVIGITTTGLLLTNSRQQAEAILLQI
jgi:hypothetical protein